MEEINGFFLEFRIASAFFCYKFASCFWSITKPYLQKLTSKVYLQILASKSPEIKIYDPDLAPVDKFRKSPTSRQGADGARQERVSFVPHKPGKYVICAVEDRVAIDDTPFSVCFCGRFLNVVEISGNSK